MKNWMLLLLLFFCQHEPAEAQIREVVQFATLSPTIFVVTSDMENYKKTHYTLSTVAYMGSYMITDSIWKSAVITLSLGIAKELIYDALLGRGTPLWEDMKWNTLGTAQGMVFTVSLRF